MNRHFKRAIEVTVPDAVSTKFNFPTDQVLNQQAYIDAIEFFRIGVVAKSPISLTKANVADAIFNKAFLTLITQTSSGDERISKIPLTLICRADNYGRIMQMDLEEFVNITQCFIEITDNAGLVADTRFVGVVHYHKK